MKMKETRVAVVTGGASGIGLAAAVRLASDGYDVAILDQNMLEPEVIDQVAKVESQVKFYKCDVSEEAAVEETASRVAIDLGAAEVLVSAAGLIPNPERVMDMDMTAHDRMWKVNYNGTIYACRSFGRQMIERKKGAIVTLGSINSRLPLPLPAYNPGKAAIERLSQLLAVELGRFGIRVNSVAPTYVMTPPLRRKIENGERDLRKIMSAHALDFLPEPSDVADAIAFLCSSQARAITGVLLPVDSGCLSAVSYKTYAGGVPWMEER
jgi:NAD(P)-dependent dehydrogenase (short-subunit alcohol dehydrogenase family)